MRTWSVVRAIMVRDLKAEWRRREILTTIGMFGLLTVVTFVFTFDPTRHARHEILPGALWTAFFFAGMLGLSRSAARDERDGLGIGMRVSPVDRGAVYVGKLLSHGIFMVAGEVVVLACAIVFFDLDGRHLRWELFQLIALGTVGFLATGTVFAAIGQKTRLREVMLPVLLLPVLLPLVMAMAEGTAIVLEPGDDRGLAIWMRVAAALDVVFLASGFLLFGYVIED